MAFKEKLKLLASRPLSSYILLATVVLLFPSIIVPWWGRMAKQMEHNLYLDSQKLSSTLTSQIHNTAKLLHTVNSSAINLGRLMDSSLEGTALVSCNVQEEVAPLLFNALTVVPYISHAMYIGTEGSFFSYYYDGNETFAIYSKTAAGFCKLKNQNSREHFIWYKQTVDPSTGKPEGVPIESNIPTIANASLVQPALNSTNGYATVGRGVDSDEDLLILNTVSVKRQGAVSLGFPVKTLTEVLRGIDFYGGSLYLGTQDGQWLVRGLNNTRVEVSGTSVSLWSLDRQNESHVAEISCAHGGGEPQVSLLKMGENENIVGCSTIELLGVPSVYVLSFPYGGQVHNIKRKSRVALTLLIVMMAVVIISIVVFVLLMVKATKREVHICSALIKQKEATEQAERKYMNKSKGIASASHDIGNQLNGITGWICMCYEEVPPGSAMEAYLKQMDDCTKDLVGLLNSILVSSKIEAGKMELAEEEFNIASLLEEVVDFHYPMGLKKGIDVVLDSCDGSILKYFNVKGDRLWLKRILCNLIGNAVKFTSEGHVSVRSWAKKPSLQNMITAGKYDGSRKPCSCLFRNEKGGKKLEIVNAAKQNQDCIEFVFEVEDTGKGIPKEKQCSVFENFVQVKETAFEHEGTGLGLGIVQSLVRLMDGDIEIVDKSIGEKGTCFKFNIFLTTSRNLAMDNSESCMVNRVNSISDSTPVLTRASAPSFTIRATGPLLSVFSSSARCERSHVVLLIQAEERRRTTQMFVESLGIKVSVVEQWECIHEVLRKIKNKCSSDKLDVCPGSDTSSTGCKDLHSSSMDGTDQHLPTSGNSSGRAAAGFLLLVIDASSGPYEELYNAVDEFKRGISGVSCKVVWLDKPTSRRITSSYQGRIDPTDDILLQPFHGSRLYRVLGLLPEFREGGLSKSKKDSAMQRVSSYLKQLDQPNSLAPSTSDEKFKPPEQSMDKPLTGMRFLVVDDTRMIRVMTKTTLEKLGASVDACENGKEALDRIGLLDQSEITPSLVPYDYVLMDCEMPELDGYGATEEIRKREIRYGVHIPIFGISAHESKGAADKMIEAGMDDHLSKPLSGEHLLEAIGKYQKKLKLHETIQDKD
ncbi:hypothetical protein K2173_006957 [Erythroxylum novogranatense]|uniref:histidine kinase n=1 Tax=Erythroxylum novogranatense TaxID=1862640 RepID=A0AAV8S6X6_9ROSI|nr:hypothetical protein K2173_006957 [Erythroxylum novogranatense]